MFVGRQEYVQKIKYYLRTPGSHVSIIGAGGSGKSQLAFKAIHECEKEGIIDLVIPIYLDVGVITFDQFLLKIADKFGIPQDQFEKYDIDKRKDILTNMLSEKSNPLIFVDSYETISSVLNNPAITNPTDEVVQINYFLNNNLPSNTSILLTSREINNLDVETKLELEGLKEEEGKKLFTTLVREDYLKKPTGTVHSTIDSLLKKTGGHPLSIEIIAKNITSIDEIEEVSRSLGVREINKGEPNERLRSLKNSFDYTINRLDDNLKQLLFKLTLFKSPFPISAATEIFGVKGGDVLELYERTMLTRIESDDVYGEIKNSEYWLYRLHPALRNYLESKVAKNLEKDYGEAFSQYYLNFLSDTYYAWGKENHVPSIARFNIITESEYNDFDKAIELASKENRQVGADISSYLGLIFQNLGKLTTSLSYLQRSLAIHEQLGDRVGLAKDYTNIGLVLGDMGRLEEALEYHNKALEIDKQLNDTVGLAKDYTNIGLVLGDMGRLEEALDYHKKSLAIDEQLGDRVGLAKDYTNIGDLLNNMNNYEEAIKYLDKSIDIQPDNTLSWDDKAYALFNLQQYKESIEASSNALAIDVNYANALYNRSCAKVRIGEIDDGLSDLKKAIELDERYTELAKNDSSFESIRDDKRFKALFSRLT